MTEILLIVVLCVVCIFLGYLLIKVKLQFEEYKRAESDRVCEARKNAINQSRAVLGGKFTEQLIPYLPGFSYDPTDARFLGSPIDFVVFPGLAEGDPTEVVFIEVKSGKSGRLTPKEKCIQKLVEGKKVRWELIHSSVE